MARGLMCLAKDFILIFVVSLWSHVDYHVMLIVETWWTCCIESEPRVSKVCMYISTGHSASGFMAKCYDVCVI